MIAHVAQAGENRGRVVLELSAGRALHKRAIDGAVRVAQAYRSEIESLFIEDRRLIDLTSYDLACEVAPGESSTRPLNKGDIEEALQHLSQDLHARVEKCADLARVNVHTRIIRDEPLRAIAETCARTGPWNVLVLSDPVNGGEGPEIQNLFASVRDITGIIVSGYAASPAAGPVYAIIEDINRLPAMVTAAERIASVTSDETVALLIGDDAEYVRWMEDQTRLAMAEAHNSTVRIESGADTYGQSDCIVEHLRAAGCGFAVAQFGGRAVPTDDLTPIAGSLPCPLFLVR